MRVPFADLAAQYQRHRIEFDRAVSAVIEKSAFIGGQPVRDFEEAYAASYGVRHCISCGNGTDAIYIALRMLGIKPGDEVITTAASWISTSETICQAGATPVFVDVDDFYLLDVECVERAITPRTRAIIPVHLYGQAAAMAPIAEICSRRGLALIEDCAQAHFAQWNGRRVGTFGQVGTFSFYPGKNLGAWGDAGAMITNDDDLARSLRMYANHGALVKHQHEIDGINSRMDGLQAALLTAKLPHVEQWTQARRRLASFYDRSLAGIGDIKLPAVRDGATHVYHLYVINTARRDELKKYLAYKEIETAIHYPTALPLLKPYRRLGTDASAVPRAAGNQQRILSLPMYAEMTDDMAEYVVESITKFFRAAPA